MSKLFIGKKNCADLISCFLF